MSPVPLRLFDAWQPMDAGLFEANLSALVVALNAVARRRAYQVPRANVGLTAAQNGLNFTEPLTTPWVLIRTSDGSEVAPVVEADAPTPLVPGVVRRAPAVEDVALVPGDPAASAAALVAAVNALLAGLQATGAMVWINQAKPSGSTGADGSAWAMLTQSLATWPSTLSGDGSLFTLELVP